LKDESTLEFVPWLESVIISSDFILSQPALSSSNGSKAQVTPSAHPQSSWRPLLSSRPQRRDLVDSEATGPHMPNNHASRP